jgi:hypothetical protein
LLVPVLPGGAHQDGGQEQAQFAAQARPGTAEVAQQVAAVGVEQDVPGGHRIVPAERVDLRLVD